MQSLGAENAYISDSKTISTDFMAKALYNKKPLEANPLDLRTRRLPEDRRTRMGDFFPVVSSRKEAENLPSGIVAAAHAEFSHSSRRMARMRAPPNAEISRLIKLQRTDPVEIARRARRARRIEAQRAAERVEAQI